MLFKFVYTLFVFRTSLGDSVEGSLFEYGFLRSDCISGYFSEYYDSNIGVLKRNKNITECQLGNGISVKSQLNPQAIESVVSIDPISVLYPQLQYVAGVTFNVWIQPSKYLANDAPIFSFADLFSTATGSCVSNFEVAQKASSFSQSPLGAFSRMCMNGDSQISFPSVPLPTSSPSDNDNDNDMSLNFVYLTYSLSYSSFIYKKVTIYEMNMNISVNAELVSSTTHTTTSGSYHIYDTLRATNRLHLLNSKLITSTAAGNVNIMWDGVLHYISMYPHVLSDSEIMQNYMQGLPNSLPVTWNATVVVSEDGMADKALMDHAMNATYFEQNTPWSDLETITISCYDADDQLGHPNRNLGNHMSVEILTLPQYGVLYQNTYMSTSLVQLKVGDVITPQFDSNTQNYSYNVRYRPDHNKHSIVVNAKLNVFDRFSFAARDGTTRILNVNEDSVTKSFINIIVTPVNDPPTPDKTIVQFVNDGQYTVLTLTGTDVDGDGTIDMGYISVLPTRGTLHTVSSTGVIDLTPIVLPLYLYFNLTKCVVAYRYGGVNTEVDQDGILDRDSFTFHVSESSDRKLVSVGGVFSIKVLSSLISTPIKSISFENSVVALTLCGVDISDSIRPLALEIYSNPQYGEILNVTSLKVLNPGTKLYSLSANGTYSFNGKLYTQYCQRVLYSSLSSNFFSSPSTGVDTTTTEISYDYFEYSIVTNYANGRNSKSPKGKQLIDVINTNDATGIAYAYPPNGDVSNVDYLQIFAFSNAYAIDEESLWRLNISGIQLTDVDHGIDMIRVVVNTTQGGLVSLNEEYLDGVTFTSDDYCMHYTYWTCLGDGYDDSLMSFVGSVQAVSKVLHGMTYVNTQGGIMDNINVLLYDGAGGDCISFLFQEEVSRRDKCLLSSVVIKVRVDDYDSSSSDDGGGDSVSSSNFLSLLKVLSLRYIVFVSIAACIVCALLCRCGVTKLKSQSLKDPNAKEIHDEESNDFPRHEKSSKEIEPSSTTRSTQIKNSIIWTNPQSLKFADKKKVQFVDYPAEDVDGFSDGPFDEYVMSNSSNDLTPVNTDSSNSI